MRTQTNNRPFLNSQARYDQGYKLLSAAKKLDVKTASAILNDTSCDDPNGYICRPYTPFPDGTFGNVGTIMRIIMDLKTKKLYLAKGNDPLTSLQVQY